MPKDWKIANVVPVHKKKSKSTVTNYRPVSLLSVASKIMEKVINKQLTGFLEQNGILSQHQFGFRSKRGTGDLMAALHTHWLQTLENGGCVRLLAVDIAGAFDRVSHVALLHKAGILGIKGDLHRWLSGYLSDRYI